MTAVVGSTFGFCHVCLLRGFYCKGADGFCMDLRRSVAVTLRANLRLPRTMLEKELFEKLLNSVPVIGILKRG